MPEKPLIIYDTDMDTDCDDTGALVMLLNAAKQGKIELLGIVTDAPVPEAAPCCEAFCQYYGLDVPIGAVYTRDYAQDPRFADYRKHRPWLKDTQYYNRLFAAQLGKQDAHYPNAARVYREVLSQAEDHSVTIACVGFMTAFAELLQTQGDDLSPLSGIELVAQKVIRVVSMGDMPTEGDRCTSFNYHMDMGGTAIAFEKCPVPVHVSAVGTHVITGAHLTDTLPQEHPLRLAYESYNGLRTGRSSWDLVAVLQAMQPDNPWQKLEHAGTVHADYESHRMWHDPQGTRQDQFVLSTIPDDKMAALLNSMLK